MEVFCPACNKTVEFAAHLYRCNCGGAWEPLEIDSWDEKAIISDRSSLWRYQRIFDLLELSDYSPLGAGWTPLVESNWEDKPVWFKLEYIAPSGSFKDRGTEVEMNFLKAVGVKEVVEDSSGNAGAAVAAYAARLGLNATVFAPDRASSAKLDQVQVYGARLKKIPGPRIKATQAALKAIEDGTVYASHAYHPAYLLGQQTFAWEIWEQMAGRIPDAVVIPVGQGGLLMGTWLGFRCLLHMGILEKLPRLYAVQPKVMAPVYQAISKGLDHVPSIEPEGRSIIEGLAIIQPVRGKRILEGLRESNGDAFTVTEVEIENAYHKLAERGFFVEPSSAAAAAALPQVFRRFGKNAKVVVALTGSGLKSRTRL